MTDREAAAAAIASCPRCANLDATNRAVRVEEVIRDLELTRNRTPATLPAHVWTV